MARPVMVRVSGPAAAREIVRRAIASALSNIGAFDVTARGEPGFAGDGNSCDPAWMQELADLAAVQTRVIVERA